MLRVCSTRPNKCEQRLSIVAVDEAVIPVLDLRASWRCRGDVRKVLDCQPYAVCSLCVEEQGKPEAQEHVDVLRKYSTFSALFTTQKLAVILQSNINHCKVAHNNQLQIRVKYSTNYCAY